jgi:hypothetical protein
MIYGDVDLDTALSQGDIIDRCPVLFWQESASDWQPETFSIRAVVLTQACDLAQRKATRVLVATVHAAQHLVAKGVLKPTVISDQIRYHRVYGWYFLPHSPSMVESIVDLRDLHTIPRPMLEELVAQGNRIARITTPFREHMAQHFSITYSRIGLPEPYETEESGSEKRA